MKTKQEKLLYRRHWDLVIKSYFYMINNRDPFVWHRLAVHCRTLQMAPTALDSPYSIYPTLSLARLPQTSDNAV